MILYSPGKILRRIKYPNQLHSCLQTAMVKISYFKQTLLVILSYFLMVASQQSSVPSRNVQTEPVSYTSDPTEYLVSEMVATEEGASVISVVQCCVVVLLLMLLLMLLSDWTDLSVLLQTSRHHMVIIEM